MIRLKHATSDRFQHAGNLLQQWEDPETSTRLAYLATIEHPAHQGDVQLELRGIFKKLAEQEQGALVDVLIEKSKSTGLSVVEKKELAELLKQNKKYVGIINASVK